MVGRMPTAIEEAIFSIAEGRGERPDTRETRGILAYDSDGCHIRNGGRGTTRRPRVLAGCISMFIRVQIALVTLATSVDARVRTGSSDGEFEEQEARSRN